MRAPSVLAAIVALIVCAAFVIGIRQAASINRLNTLVDAGHGLTRAQQRSAASELRSAAFGYPGEDVQVLKAQVALLEHRYRQAERIAESINRSEPDNLQGWIMLAAAGLNNHDRSAAVRAKAEEIRLDPIDARPG
jgi:predicted Zn-dependent protease